MSGTVARRLERLEKVMGSVDIIDLPKTLVLGRRTVLAMSPGELRHDLGERLQGMLAQHAADPLRGLELRRMHALARVLDAAEKKSPDPQDRLQRRYKHGA